MTRKRVLVALSGGVDSAVSAYLLQKAGYDVHGVFFRSWQNETEPWKACPWKEDSDSARAVAEHLHIPFEIINFIELYREKVVKYLLEGYKKGETPNPDVMCNRYVKFGALVEYAQTHKFDYLATGHYARKKEDEPTFSIYEGLDKNKDQTYFLCLVKKENLKNVLFPLGPQTKPEVRTLAQEIHLPNATRRDSQGICFLGGREVAINPFLDRYLPQNPGEIVDLNGRVLGTHTGLHHFTIGQRKGLNIPSNKDFEHYVVLEKNLEQNRLIVGFDHPETPKLYTQKVHINQLNFLEESPQEGEELLAKPRYRDTAQDICWHWLDPITAQVTFLQPQRALAVGQVIAFYRKDLLVGGGIYQHIEF